MLCSSELINLSWNRYGAIAIIWAFIVIQVRKGSYLLHNTSHFQIYKDIKYLRWSSGKVCRLYLFCYLFCLNNFYFILNFIRSTVNFTRNYKHITIYISIQSINPDGYGKNKHADTRAYVFWLSNTHTKSCFSCI